MYQFFLDTKSVCTNLIESEDRVSLITFSPDIIEKVRNIDYDDHCPYFLMQYVVTLCGNVTRVVTIRK